MSSYSLSILPSSIIEPVKEYKTISSEKNQSEFNKWGKVTMGIKEFKMLHNGMDPLFYPKEFFKEFFLLELEIKGVQFFGDFINVYIEKDGCCFIAQYIHGEKNRLKLWTKENKVFSLSSINQIPKKISKYISEDK